MKSVFSQLSHKFKYFGTYLSPTYYHDRCERSVHMRLYTMHKREIVFVFAAFLATFGVCFFIGLAGPSITNTAVTNATSIIPKLNESQMATGPFVLKSPLLSPYCQQLWVIARVVLQLGDDERFNKPFRVLVTIYGISDENEKVVVVGKNKSRTRELHCIGITCDEVMLLHLGFIDFSHYITVVHFDGLERIEVNYKIKDIMFYFKSYNPSFTQIEIWFRFAFLAVAFGVMCWFHHCLRPFNFFDWSMEQKWISFLLPMVILFNDPVFPLSFLINSWLPGMLDAVFQSTFLCCVLLFWLWIYHGIRQNGRTFSKFYVPKFLIVGSLWIAALTLASWQKYSEKKDPTYDYRIDTGYFMGFEGCFIALGCIYVTYLLYLVIQAFMELRSMPYFDIRLKFSTILMVIIIAISIALTISRFGITLLQDNFMAELSTNYGTSVVFMSYYSLMNAYIITMAYMYAPPKKACFETRVKDNPTLSMINDSDDDVLYGSDSENYPLNPLNKRQDKEESD